jgi:hypothetical protein
MTVADGDATLLVLSSGLPLYAARGLTQSLTPIQASAVQRRTINGVLLDLSYAQFRKYQSTISCTDREAPAMDGVFPGMEVTVYCVAELSYPAGGTPTRPVVSGSERPEGEFIFYRPILTMQVTTLSMSLDEYAADTQWSLQLEEV